jgi:hypothetical protein
MLAKCGSWLAAMAVVAVDSDVECAALIAGKPAPTLVLGLG